jgi:hypothetical protein
MLIQLQGNVTMVISSSTGVVLGNSTIENMTLVPGNNTLPMTGILDQALVIGSIDKSSGMVEMSIVGRDAIYNGQHLPYYEKALASNKLTMKMNVQQVLADSAHP